MIADSFPRLRGSDAQEGMRIVNTVLNVVFTLELVLRFAAAPSWRAIVKDVYNVIDICAIAGVYIELVCASVTQS